MLAGSSAASDCPVKILIANRGEIAVRIMRACREMAISSVAVYSDCDRDARHVLEADQAFHIGPSEAAKSYLDIPRILEVARRAGADAVHPGYGFLAENAAFARACTDAGITFIGPSHEVISLMGNKTSARAAAMKAGVPVVPGTETALPDSVPENDIVDIASRVGYPIVVKAVAGGGGKGMRTVDSEAALVNAIRTARSEARSAFGDSAIYLERRIVRPRHIEVQLLGDLAGTVIPFVERECSIQRRHQKVVEESPSMAVDSGAAPSPGRGGGLSRADRRVHERRDDRIPAGRGRFVLLPRDEHAPPGRAPRHRDGDEHRPGEMADPDRARRVSRHRSGARPHTAPARRRVPHLRGGSGPRLPAVAGAHPWSAARFRARRSG